MPIRLRKVLLQVGSFVLAGVLLYLALRGVAFDAVWQALRMADYRWLVPMVVVALTSHLLRAWRWTLLLEALAPTDGARGAVRPSLGTAFSSVMIGYMVNYAAPRLGEVARTANLSRRARLPFTSVFGTVVVERILDVIVLAVLLLTTGVLLLDRSAEVQRLFVEPIAARVGALPLGLLAALAAGGGIVFALVVRRNLGRAPAGTGFWATRVVPVLASFRDGLATVVRARRRGGLVLATVGIWALYVLLAHLPFLLLGIAGPYEITLADTLCIMALGAIGVALPTPGGAGPFHWITVLTLTRLYGVPEAPAAAYAVLVHAAQLILYTLVGGLCLIAQGTSLRALRATTATEPPAEVPATSDRS